MLRFGSRSGLSPFSILTPLVVVVVLVAEAPDFTAGENLANLAGQLVVLLLGALGQLLVALVGGIDLSIGPMVSLTTCILATHDSLILGIGASIVVGLAVGLANGFGVVALEIHPLVMTLSMATFLQGVALVVLPSPVSRISAQLSALATTVVLGLPVALLWCIASASVTFFLLRKTRMGLHIFAVGSSSTNAYLSGVRTGYVTAFPYVFCSLCAVAAGIFLTGRVSSGDATMGGTLALDSVTAIALGSVQLTGGIGSVLGATLGTLTLGLLTNGMNLIGISPFARSALSGALLLLAISLQRRKVIGL